MNTTILESRDKQNKKLGLTFHRTFPLKRSAVADVLRLAGNIVPDQHTQRCLTREAIRELTNLGTIYVEAMPRYSLGAGLLDAKNCLTPFGAMAYERDPFLEQLSTQWLMHYYLCAPHGPGPAFWNELVRSRFKTGNEFTAEELIVQLGEFFVRTEGKSLAERSARSTVTVFLGTYLKTEALGHLGILEKVGEGRYQVLAPKAPPPWACACALLDYWQAHCRELVTISQDTLLAPGGFTDLLMIGGSHLNTVLRAMEGAGYVEVYRVAPPYQVVLLRQDVEPLLERMYGLDQSA